MQCALCLSSYLFNDFFHLVRSELLLVNSLIFSCIQSVESFIIFKELSQSLKQQSELRELDKIVSMRVFSLGHSLDMVEAAVDGRNGIKQLINSNHISHTFGHLSQRQVAI